MTVAQDGYAELAVYDVACLPRGFWHWWDLLLPDCVQEIHVAGGSGKIKGLVIEKDPNGHCRVMDCWLRGRRRELTMPYVEGVAQHHVPEFEAAWTLVVGLFPVAPS